MTNEELQERAKECQKIAERILKERGMQDYRARLDIAKMRIVIEQFYDKAWHFECDCIFHTNNKIEYWSCGSTSWFYDFSIEQFEKLMRNAGNYHIV